MAELTKLGTRNTKFYRRCWNRTEGTKLVEDTGTPYLVKSGAHEVKVFVAKGIRTYDNWNVTEAKTGAKLDIAGETQKEVLDELSRLDTFDLNKIVEKIPEIVARYDGVPANA